MHLSSAIFRELAELFLGPFARDLSQDSSFSAAMVAAGLLEPLVNLLDEDQELARGACQVIESLGEEASIRTRLA